jgi:hypothetical protein
VHPGYTATNLQTERFPFWEQLNQLAAMDVEHGALSQIFGWLRVFLIVPLN